MKRLSSAGPCRRVRAPLAVAASCVLAATLAAVAPLACGSTPADSSRVAPDATTPRASIAVVPAQYLPEVGIVPASHAAAEAAAKGAALGAAQGALTGIQFLAAGPAGVVAALGAALAFSTLGAIYGASTAPPDARVGPVVPQETMPGLREQMVASVAADIGRFTPYVASVVPGIGPRSRDEVPDYRALAARGYRDVVEVAASQVGLVGQGGADPMFTLVVAARARRVDTATGATTTSRGLVYQSPRRARDEWAREQGKLMRAELSRAQATLAGRVVDDLMLHAGFATDPDAERLPSLCGVAPLRPAPEWRRDPVYDRELALSRVDSVTPTLAWEAGPPTSWPYDLAAWERTAGRRYDLRIWSAEDHIPGDLVYERTGLADTTHVVETALAPRASYFWSVRLRYTQDGEPYATRWSAACRPAFRFVLPMGDALFHAPANAAGSRASTCAPSSYSPCACLDFIPATNYLWFRTP